MSTPIRLDDRLVRQATAEAQANRRTAPKQIELWAELGQLIAHKITADDLVALTQGLLDVKLEPVHVTPPASDEIWAQVAHASQRGDLTRAIAQQRVLYQSTGRDDVLEAIYPDASRVLGRFINGHFVKIDHSDHAA